MKSPYLNSFVLLLLSFSSLSCSKTLVATQTGGGGAVCNGGPTIAFTGISYPHIGADSAADNIVPITVNSTSWGSNQYDNEPTVSVTICEPDHPTVCQTISKILLDTGSFGLRIFDSAITITLPKITNGSNTLAECVTYGDGSSQWGPVEYAYVQLASEPKVEVPILAINSSYQSAPGLCTSSQSYPDTSPTQAHYNGILGVGLFAQDCGEACAVDTGNGQYFTCNGTSCGCGATADALAQVENPVAALPLDNTGVILTLPDVASGGATTVSGSMYLGIDTQANNASTGKTIYPADGYGTFQTSFSDFNSGTYMTGSFIDSGSSILFFPSSSLLTDCSVAHGSSWKGIWCPATTQSLTATVKGTDGSHPTSVSFSVANGYTQFNSGNYVFKNLGGNSLSSDGAAEFDWGLPFFFNKSVFVGIDGTTSSLGTGPYWAF